MVGTSGSAYTSAPVSFCYDKASSYTGSSVKHAYNSPGSLGVIQNQPNAASFTATDTTIFLLLLKFRHTVYVYGIPRLDYLHDSINNLLSKSLLKHCPQVEMVLKNHKC